MIKSERGCRYWSRCQRHLDSRKSSCLFQSSFLISIDGSGIETGSASTVTSRWWKLCFRYCYEMCRTHTWTWSQINKFVTVQRTFDFLRRSSCTFHPKCIIKTRFNDLTLYLVRFTVGENNWLLFNRRWERIFPLKWCFGFAPCDPWAETWFPTSNIKANSLDQSPLEADCRLSSQDSLRLLWNS